MPHLIGNIPLIYVAGAVTASTLWERARNTHRAQEQALLIQQMGAVTFLPHVEFGPFTGEWTETHVLMLCKAIILRSNALYTVPRWEKSAGTLSEIEFAQDVGVPVYHHIHDIDAFIKTYAKAHSDAAR